MLTPDSRRLFSLDDDIVYLDHGAYGVTPREVQAYRAQMQAKVEAAPRAFFDRECRPAWDAVRGVVAARFGAQAQDLALIENVTDGVNAILRSLSFQAGDEVLITSMTYGAIVRALTHILRKPARAWSRRACPSPPQAATPASRPSRAALTPRTRLAILDHITSSTALILPVAEMAEVCRARGVAVLIDGAHAPGQIAARSLDDARGLLCRQPAQMVLRAARLRFPLGASGSAAEPDADNSVLGHRRTLSRQFLVDGDARSLELAFDPLGLRFRGPFRRGSNPAAQSRAVLEACSDPGPGLGRPTRNARRKHRRHGAWFRCPRARPSRSRAKDAQTFKDSLWEAHRIACPCVLFEGRLHVRVSAQIYNEKSDYERLARAIEIMRKASDRRNRKPTHFPFAVPSTKSIALPENRGGIAPSSSR